MAGDSVGPTLRDPGDRTMWALRRAAFAVDGLKERRLRGTEVTGSQYSVLMSVLAEPGLSGADLARRLHVSPQAVVPLVRRLLELAYLDRRPHPQHTHVQELRLTELGRAALRSAEAVVEGLEQDIARVLGEPDNRRLRTLLHALAEYAGRQ